MKYRSSKRAKATDIPKAVKDRVWERDHGRCVWCHSILYAFPDAHFIRRSKGGLGIEENVLTLCRFCHDAYDRHDPDSSEQMEAFFREYLSSKYPDWDESKLYYRRNK